MIARALLLRPRVLIADEPVSMVDASLRATILESLWRLKAERGISIVYVTHDLTTAYQIADRIVVMYRGEIVEAGDPDSIIRQPAHPYTWALVGAVPRPILMSTGGWSDPKKTRLSRDHRLALSCLGPLALRSACPRSRKQGPGGTTALGDGAGRRIAGRIDLRGIARQYRQQRLCRRGGARICGRLTAFADVDLRWSQTHHQPGAPARFRAVLDRFAPLGVTHYLNEGEDAGWLSGEEGEACLGLLAERGVILSLACGAQQVPAIAEVAARHPDLTILLHHLGRPRAGDASALAAILTAAKATNVRVKVSGFAYGAADGLDFPYPAMQQVLRALCDGFGADRLCWGSDYPVVRRFMTYRQSLEIVRSHCEFLTADERKLILGSTMGGLLERAAARRRTP